MFKFVITIGLAAATIHPHGNSNNARNRRGAELHYEGEWPSSRGFGLTRREKSMFDDPRIISQLQSAQSAQSAPVGSILRRYKHLESLISFYDQSITNITKYWSYGCWCFQMGDNPMQLGKGQPADPVDLLCKNQKTCYRCAHKDEKEAGGEACLPEETSYKFEASHDPVTGQPVVKCLNKKGSCRRNICECDNEFGKKLQAASASNQWNVENSQYGGFDQRQKCLARIGGGGGMGGINNEQCCGEYPNRFTFNGNKNQCCEGKVVDNGSC